MQARAASVRIGGTLIDALHTAREPLLFAVRLWASVCLALFIAFWLELDNPFWAGTSAAIVCQPQLGASLRKGWFRMIGTLVGAVTIVALTALFPQDRVAFLALLALWGAACAFVATVLHNFASYGAALAGYTAMIIAVNTLGATGGPSSQVFLLAIWRASEICLGIVCAGIVLAGTDFGGAQQRLVTSFADLAGSIVGGFTLMLARAGSDVQDTQAERRELGRRVIALDPAIDQTLGESGHMRYHSPILQSAVYGLFVALDGWRGVATHLKLPDAGSRQARDAVLRCIPAELRSLPASSWATRWMADPVAAGRACAQARRTLLALPATALPLRLLIDETLRVLDGILNALDGLALLVQAPGMPRSDGRGMRLSVADWLPALVNAGRAFIVIGVLELFWVATAWPNGASTMQFAATVVLLLAPRGDLAYGGAIAFAIGIAGAVLCAAVIKFAVLPGLDSFPAFCVGMALFLIPAGFVMARSRHPAAMAVSAAMGVNVIPLIAPANPMSYDTVQFYNTAMSIAVGCLVAPLAFALLPPLSPAVRTRRLLRFALRDLRRLAIEPEVPAPEDWLRRMYSRLAALPDQAEPLQRAQLLATLSVGSAIIELRRGGPQIGAAVELDTVWQAIAQGRSVAAVARLQQLERRLAIVSDEVDIAVVLRARSRMMVVAEALAEHGSYFDMGQSA
jgi:uncharacterized membrane protein YccC